MANNLGVEKDGKRQIKNPPKRIYIYTRYSGVMGMLW